MNLKEKAKKCKADKLILNLTTKTKGCVTRDYADKKGLKVDARRGVAGSEKDIKEYILSFSPSKSPSKAKASPSKKAKSASKKASPSKEKPKLSSKVSK